MKSKSVLFPMVCVWGFLFISGIITDGFCYLEINSDHYEDGVQLNENGKWEEALELWQGVSEQLDQQNETDPRIGTAYIELATEKKAKFHYNMASDLYLWGFSGSIVSENLTAVFEEAKRIMPLLDETQVARWQKLLEEKSPQLSREIRLFWLQRDPQPTTKVNERLIEHWERIAYARKTFQKNKKSIYACDDRGTIYVKYGEPLRTQSGLFGTSPESEIELLRINNPSLRSAIQREDPHPEYEVWLYGKLYGNEPAIFLFSRKNGRGSFGLRTGVEDVVMRSRVEMSGDARYIYQLMYYAELKWFAKFYEERHHELEKVWNYGGPSSEYRLQSYFFENGSVDRNRMRNVRAEKSEYATKFPALKLASFAVRFLDNNNEPQLAVISKATLQQRNVNVNDPVFGAMISRPLQTLVIRDLASTELTSLEGRMSQGSGYVSIFEMTHKPGELIYAIAAEARAVAPDTFKAVGQTFFQPDAPLNADPDLLRLSDLILGHNLDARFSGPHQPRIPLMPGVTFNRRQPMQAYLEVYHLKPDGEGVAHLSIEFAAHKLDEHGRRAQKEGEISLTFDFDVQGSTSQQEHAIDLSKLEPGFYEISAKVRDTISTQEKTRRKTIKVEE